MIDAFKAVWNEHVPEWVRIRCTERFTGHVLFFLFVLGSYALVAWFDLGVMRVVESALIGGMFFLATRFILHESGTGFTTVSAIVLVAVVDVVIPALLGSGEISSIQDLVERLPLLVAMALVEVFEEDSLEEELEAEGYE